MEKKQIMHRISAVCADITSLEVDAIVNAANTSLLGGGGVDGAIHRAAGKDLLIECRKLNGCAVGEAKLTKGYLLPAKFVIHTVGPIYQKNNPIQAKLLANCYSNSLNIAQANNCTSIAFPSISTGVYGYPFLDAAQIAFSTVVAFLKNNDLPMQIIFCCFCQSEYEIYQNLINTLKVY